MLSLAAVGESAQRVAAICSGVQNCSRISDEIPKTCSAPRKTPWPAQPIP